jgi:hypothetical protein
MFIFWILLWLAYAGVHILGQHLVHNFKFWMTDHAPEIHPELEPWITPEPLKPYIYKGGDKAVVYFFCEKMHKESRPNGVWLLDRVCSRGQMVVSFFGPVISMCLDSSDRRPERVHAVIVIHLPAITNN